MEQDKDFNELKKSLKEKKDKLYKLEKTLRLLKYEIKKDTQDLQKICKHEYVRECTTTGCYAEYHNICKKCDLWS